jgi:hypothetical protein
LEDGFISRVASGVVGVLERSSSCVGKPQLTPTTRETMPMSSKPKQSENVSPAGAVQITNVTFSPTTLRPGELLNVSITVFNGTTETLATQGPNPGFVYDEGDTLSSRGSTETTESFRVAVDFGRTGVDHPFRWGLGAPRAPGQTPTITGTIRLRTVRAINY